MTDLTRLRLPKSLQRWDDGTIRVSGHRIMLYHIIECLYDHGDFNELTLRFPTVAAAQLRGILRFCNNHPDVVRQLYENLRPRGRGGL